MPTGKPLRKLRCALPPAPGEEQVTGMLWALSDRHRWRMAVALAKERALSSPELVMRLGRRRQAASHHLQVLLRAGAVRREAAVDDGRVAVYRLTEAEEGLVQAGLLVG